jgi:hypothetical protein
MFKITEHIPVYVTGIEAETTTCNSTGELLEIDYVKSHLKQPGFYRYTIHRSSSNNRIPLLAEYNNGEKWLVIGFLDGDFAKIELPAWENNLAEKI